MHSKRNTEKKITKRTNERTTERTLRTILLINAKGYSIFIQIGRKQVSLENLICRTFDL